MTNSVKLDSCLWLVTEVSASSIQTPVNTPWQVRWETLGTRLTGIECVRLTSSNSQIQNKRATKDFILIRHKKYQIYTCLQLSSSIASFVWKPAHFELRSYGGAWHNTKIALVEKYTLISWFFGHFRSLSILKEKCFSKYFLVWFR